MEGWDDVPQLNEDDLTARRILSLAIALINARRPLTSAELQRDLYPDLRPDAFKKAFLRDRTRLALAGLAIRQGTNPRGDTCWYVDEEASFVRENLLSQEDALLLDVLLAPLCGDPSLPYARDLQVALTKIDRSFDGSAEVALPPEARVRNKALGIVESSLAQRQALAISYRRADGSEVQRTVAPFGLFSFRSRPYMVAARVGEDGKVTGDKAHTYNILRILKATPRTKVTYQIPPDFDVRDYEKLPFQMGEPIATGVFVNPKSGAQLVEEIHDMDLAAAWALAKGLRPTAPTDLVTLWRQRITRFSDVLSHWTKRITACKDHISQYSKQGRSHMRNTPRIRSGRPRNTEKVRELVALIGSLCTTGDTITLEAVSKRLGLSMDEARATMEIVCEAGGEESGGLLISSNDEETVFTLQYPGTHGRPIRLTKTETVAVLRALDAVGIPDGDPLRNKLSSAFTSSSVQIEEVRQALGAPAGTDVTSLCAQAQAQGRALEFWYTGVKETEPRKRRAAVRSLMTKENSWYVQAYDLDREQDRTFRTDRMTKVTLGETTAAPSSQSVLQPCLKAYFLEDTYYDVFSWYDIQNVRTYGDVICANLPYYGNRSTWLPRRIIACDGALLIDDETVYAETVTYLKGLEASLGEA